MLKRFGVICLLCAWTAPGWRAQDFSGLQNKELRSDGFADVMGAWAAGLAGVPRDATVSSVIVRQDRERLLSLEVHTSNLDGKQLRGEVIGAERKAKSQVTAAPTPISASGITNLTFELPADVPEGTTLQSAHVRLIVENNGRAMLTRMFALPKRWQSTVAPDHLLIEYRLKPIGAAARLGAQPPKDVPPIPAPPVAPPAKHGLAERQAIRERAGWQPAPPARPMTAEKAAIGRKTEQALQKLALSNRTTPLDAFVYGVKPDDARIGARGPSINTLDLFEGLQADVPLDRNQISSIFPQVYKDQNENAGIFYFLPRAYHLDWDADNGYALKILYEAAAEGQAGEVIMATRMSSGADTSEVQLARALVQAYKERNTSMKFTDVRPMPIVKPPEVSLNVGLQRQFNIPADKIAVHAISDALGEVELSWVTDTVTTENLKAALREDIGLTGNVTYTPAGGVLQPQLIPITIRLAEPAVFGHTRWNRSEPWRNNTPYPLRVRYLHALVIEKSIPYVYSWKLDRGAGDFVEIPPRAEIRYAGDTVPDWLDARAEAMWLDYETVQNCRECDDQVMEGIVGGAAPPVSSTLMFRTMTPMADTGAYEIDIQVRSKYFHPRDRDMRTKGPLVLNKDNQDFPAGAIYLVGRQPGESRPNDPLFEYLLSLTMPDGTTVRSDHWTPGNDMRVPIGKKQLTDALGILPPKQ